MTIPNTSIRIFAAFGLAAVCHATGHLAALSPVALPSHRKPPTWALSGDVKALRRKTATGGNHTHHSGSGTVFFDSEVEKWLHISGAESLPKPFSPGWRLVASNPLKSEAWCARRVTFKDDDASEVNTSDCKYISAGAHSLTDEYLPGHAFQDDSADGCSLRDQAGLWYIGILCDSAKTVAAADLVQVTLKGMSMNSKMQQLRGGTWMDVGGWVSLPSNATKTVFEAAVCDPNTCGSKYAVKHASEFPKTCAKKQCSRHECCFRKATCDLGVCTTFGYTLRPQAKGVRCRSRECQESFCCQQRGVCSAKVCLGGMRLKSSYDAFCKGIHCTVGECCYQVAVCNQAFCNTFHKGHSVIGAGLQCAQPTCTEEECCTQGNGQTDDKCQESDCPVGHVFTGYNKTCASGQCTVHDCCASVSNKAAVQSNLFFAVPQRASIGGCLFFFAAVLAGVVAVLVSVRHRQNIVRCDEADMISIESASDSERS